MSTGRIAGLIFIVIALVALFVGAAWLIAAVEDAGGMVLGLALLLLFLVLPVGGVGVYMLLRGRGEEAQQARAREQSKILNMVLTQGKVRLDELALALNKDRGQIEEMVRDLVGKQLFTGAVNWQQGILYSKEASQLKSDHRCPNCGGEVELAGKGMIRCPWCGSEVFLHLD